MKNRPVHFFNAKSLSANLCDTKPRNLADWQRKNWCSSWTKKVTCKKCLRLIEKM